MKTNKKSFAITLALSCIFLTALFCLLAKAYNVIIAWDNLAEVGIFVALVGVCVGVVGFIAAKIGLGKSVKGSIVRGIGCTVASMVVLFGLLTVNAQLFMGRKNSFFVGAAFVGIIAILLCLCLILCNGKLSGMRIGKRVLCLLLSAVLLFGFPVGSIFGGAALAFSGGTSVIGYTDGEPIIATRRDYCFDNSSLLIGGYCNGDTDNDEQLVKWAREAGLSFLFSGCKDEAFLTACDENSLGILLGGDSTATLPHVYAGSTDEDFKVWKEITKEKYYADPVHSHPCIWGNSFIDEPRFSQFENIGESVKAFNKNIDGKIAIVNHYPIISSKQFELDLNASFLRSLPFFESNDSASDRISTYRTLVSTYINSTDTDYICADIYPLSVSVNNDGSLEELTGSVYWLRNLDILAEACRKTNRDLWVIMQSSGKVPDSEESTGLCVRYTDTPEEIRWQYYVSISFGAKALINALYYSGWWDSDSHMIDANKQRTDTYYAVQTATKEVGAFTDVYGDYMNLGAFLVNGKDAAGNKTNTLTPVEAEAKKPDVSSEAPVLVGCFNEKEGEGRAYTLVNMFEPGTGKSAAVTATFEGASEITLYRMGEKTTIEGNTLELTLESYEGVFVTVR